ALATGELDGARGVASAVGIAHRTITTDELAREDYRRNDKYRCYHCKTELYDRLQALANAEGYAAVLSGANGDDAGDWRRGLRVRHYGELGRVELAADELERALADREPVIAAVLDAGYRRAEISERPFRSGSLNVSIVTTQPGI